MSFDIADTLAPNSDQLDAVDLLGGERTFTIERISRGNAEQPVNIHLAEFPRPWRPGKSMRRVLAAAWGTDASVYVGRRVTLYCDPDVIFGKEKVGGTRIKAMSHIDGPKRVPLLVSRGKSATYTVEPLPDAPAPAPATDRITKAVNAFASIGVDQARLGTALGPDRNAWDLEALLAAYTSIKNGDTTVDEAFPTDADTTGGDDQ